MSIADYYSNPNPVDLCHQMLRSYLNKEIDIVLWTNIMKAKHLNILLSIFETIGGELWEKFNSKQQYRFKILLYTFHKADVNNNILKIKKWIDEKFPKIRNEFEYSPEEILANFIKKLSYICDVRTKSKSWELSDSMKNEILKEKRNLIKTASKIPLNPENFLELIMQFYTGFRVRGINNIPIEIAYQTGTINVTDLSFNHTNWIIVLPRINDDSEWVYGHLTAAKSRKLIYHLEFGLSNILAWIYFKSRDLADICMMAGYIFGHLNGVVIKHFDVAVEMEKLVIHDPKVQKIRRTFKDIYTVEELKNILIKGDSIHYKRGKTKNGQTWENGKAFLEKMNMKSCGVRLPRAKIATMLVLYTDIVGINKKTITVYPD